MWGPELQLQLQSELNISEAATKKVARNLLGLDSLLHTKAMIWRLKIKRKNSQRASKVQLRYNDSELEIAETTRRN